MAKIIFQNADGKVTWSTDYPDNVYVDDPITVTATAGLTLGAMHLKGYRKFKAGVPGYFPDIPEKTEEKDVPQTEGLTSYTFTIEQFFNWGKYEVDELTITIDTLGGGGSGNTEAPYSQSLTNATSNVAPDSIVTNEHVVVIQAISNYIFTNDIQITTIVDGAPIVHTFHKDFEPEYFNADNNIFTLPLADIWDDAIEGVEVYAVATEKPGRDIRYRQDLINATSSVAVNDYGEKTVPINTTVTLTAKEGHEFQSTIEVRYVRQFNPDFKKTFHPLAESQAEYFNEDKTQFTLKMSEFDEYDVIMVVFEAIAKEKYTGDDVDVITGRTTPFANVYYADDGILARVVSDRFYNTGSSYIDFGEYIYQVYKYPIKIEEDYVSADPIAIQLGRHASNTESRYFLRSRVKFPLGKISVAEEYNNVYDYRDVTCLLHVPYSDPIEIPYTYIIGSGIDLYYLLDLYNGTTTLEVYSDKIEGGLVLRQDIEVAYKVPFMKHAYNDVKGEIGRYLSNKVVIPYIEVIRPIPYDTESEQGKEGKEVGELREFTGYVEVRDVKLIGDATEFEKRRIRDLLATGVFINDETPPVAP